MSNDDLLQNFDDSDQFMKVNEYVKLNSKGEGGISLFKKRKKKIAKREEPKEMLKEGQFVTDGGIGRRAKSERKNKTLKSFSLKEKIEKNRREEKESKKKEKGKRLTI